MSKKDKLNHESKDAYWQNHVNTCAAKGMRKTDYCRTHGIDYKQFIYYGQQLANKSITSTKASFIPITIEEPCLTKQNAIIATLELPGNYMLTFHDEGALLSILNKWR